MKKMRPSNINPPYIVVSVLFLQSSQNNIIRRLSPLAMGIYIIHPLLIRIGAHFVKIDKILLSLIYFAAVLLAFWLLCRNTIENPCDE